MLKLVVKFKRLVLKGVESLLVAVICRWITLFGDLV